MFINWYWPIMEGVWQRRQSVIISIKCRKIFMTIINHSERKIRKMTWYTNFTQTCCVVWKPAITANQRRRYVLSISQWAQNEKNFVSQNVAGYSSEEKCSYMDVFSAISLILNTIINFHLFDENVHFVQRNLIQHNN